ncbi:hypothetical protein [Sinomonas atrocyanea]|uniref:hypothetical protein n=1 Tax=Sinomonas atrocyanea TaxID=37927 RepID=UPI001142589F|nr:hypothetical protein [Sinomonas atrocyanea]
MTSFVRALYSFIFGIGYLSLFLVATFFGQRDEVLGQTIVIIALALGTALVVCTQVLSLRRRRAARAQRQAVKDAAAPRLVEFEESAFYRCDAQRIWQLIRPAQSDILLDEARSAFTVPGTPSGIGEQQCSVRHDGSVSIVEILAEEAPKWLVVVSVAPAQPGFRQTYRLEEAEEGCRLSIRCSLMVPAGFRSTEEGTQQWHRRVRRYMERIDEVLSLKDVN